MLDTPFSPWPDYTDAECAAVQRIMRSNRVNYWTGNECKNFELAYARYFKSKHAIALANGTLALDVALLAIGIQPSDEVIVTPRSYIASVSSVCLADAVPVFADVDRNTQNISAATVAPLITDKTKAVIVVHLAGFPADMDELCALCEENNIHIIEDCAQAHGALYKGKPVGSFGDIATWSFCQDKIMTTGGEGGMVTTNDDSLWEFMWSYKDHGKSFAQVHRTDHPPGYRWLHDSFGSNFRMLEIQAAIGNEQLEMMPQWSKKRLANAEKIWQASSQSIGLRVPSIPDDVVHAAYRAYVFVEPSNLKSGWNRDRIVSEISALGVPVYVGSCAEIYLEKAFDGKPYKPEKRLAVAQELGETSLCFLTHPTLTDAEIDQTCAAIQTTMQKAVR